MGCPVPTWGCPARNLSLVSSGRRQVLPSCHVCQSNQKRDFLQIPSQNPITLGASEHHAKVGSRQKQRAVMDYSTQRGLISLLARLICSVFLLFFRFLSFPYQGLGLKFPSRKSHPFSLLPQCRDPIAWPRFFQQSVSLLFHDEFCIFLLFVSCIWTFLMQPVSLSRF